MTLNRHLKISIWINWKGTNITYSRHRSNNIRQQDNLIWWIHNWYYDRKTYDNLVKILNAFLYTQKASFVKPRTKKSSFPVCSFYHIYSLFSPRMLLFVMLMFLILRFYVSFYVFGCMFVYEWKAEKIKPFENEDVFMSNLKPYFSYQHICRMKALYIKKHQKDGFFLNGWKVFVWLIF